MAPKTLTDLLTLIQSHISDHPDYSDDRVTKWVSPFPDGKRTVIEYAFGPDSTNEFRDHRSFSILPDQVDDIYALVTAAFWAGWETGYSSKEGKF